MSTWTKAFWIVASLVLAFLVTLMVIAVVRDYRSFPAQQWPAGNILTTDGPCSKRIVE